MTTLGLERTHNIQEQVSRPVLIQRSFSNLLRFMGIRTRLIVTFLLLSILPVLFIALSTSLSFARTLNDQVASYSSQLVAAVAKNVSDTLERVVVLSENIIVHPLVQEGLESPGNLSEMQRNDQLLGFDRDLNRMVFSTSTVQAMSVFRKDGSLLYETGYVIYKPEDIENMKRSISRSLQNMYWTVLTPTRGARAIALGREIYSVDDTNKSIGSLLLMIDERLFARNAWWGVDMGTDSNLFLMSGDGTIVSSATERAIPRDVLDDPVFLDNIHGIQDQLSHYFRYERQGSEPMLVACTAVPVSNWYVITLIPYRAVESVSRQVLGNVALTALIILVVATFLASTIFISIQSPLQRLTRAASEIRGGNFSLKIADNYNDETGQVSHAIDDMSARLEQLVAEISLHQEAKRRAELEMLQAQINPHFLFNTLDSLKWTAMLQGNDMVGEGIGALSALLRNSILEMGETVSLSAELENLRNYALILKLRYGDSFELVFDAAEETLSVPLPKLLLQPFVENAIIHGIDGEMGPLVTIRIVARTDTLPADPGTAVRSVLRVLIEDNGRGFDPAKRERNGGFSGIGIKNVRERIRLFYGESWGVDIESAPGTGTRVRIKLPVGGEPGKGED